MVGAGELHNKQASSISVTLISNWWRWGHCRMNSSSLEFKYSVRAHFEEVDSFKTVQSHNSSAAHPLK